VKARTHGGAVGVRGIIFIQMRFESAGALAWGGEFAELLFVALDELTQGLGEALGVHVGHDHAIRDFQEQLLLACLGIGVGHVEAEIDNHFIVGGVNSIGIAVDLAQLAFVQKNLDGGV
jgi:hypothetical protein